SGRVCNLIKENKRLAEFSWLAESTGWADYKTYKGKCDVLQSIAHGSVCGISDFEDCQAGDDYGGFDLSTANLPNALVAAMPVRPGVRRAPAEELNANQSRELQKFIRAVRGTKRTCLAVAKTHAYAYAIVEETDGEGGGQTLLRLPV